MIIESAGRSHTGTIRSNNEDRYLICSNGHDTLYWDICVCDGMGGESYGEVASEIAIQTMQNYCNNGKSGNQIELMKEANSRIINETKLRGVSRMGSTMVHLHIEEGKASVCNIGDSRAYLYIRGILMLVSTDHRLRNPNTGRSFLTQNLGISPEDFVIEPAVAERIDLEAGMIFILCSDGLTDMVNDNELQKLLDRLHGKTAEEIAVALIDKALQNGGRDNVTAVVTRIKS